MPRLKYPEMRMELLGYLRKLKDLKYQMKAWVNQDFPAAVQYDHLDLAILFIFDDTDLGSDVRMAIGEILLDEQEAALMGSWWMPSMPSLRRTARTCRTASTYKLPNGRGWWPVPKGRSIVWRGATPLTAPSRWIDTGMPASRLAGARPWLIVMSSRW
ncbi:SCO4402 family protein [Delftia acidovorans]|uniref:SCO4402 family protein n=1 Tax=Delftia acidovorans TaxID=80866 RepID=UPI001CD72D69|nr:hypothetical protein [Delftia acidovorans]